MIIASDGLWDTLPLKNICAIAWKAYMDSKLHPLRASGLSVVSNEIITAALHHMPQTLVRDNISCIVIVFEWDSGSSAAFSISPSGVKNFSV